MTYDTLFEARSPISARSRREPRRAARPHSDARRPRLTPGKTRARYWEVAALGRRPDLAAGGHEGLGGVGNGVLEIAEDLVGFQYLAYLSVISRPRRSLPASAT